MSVQNAGINGRNKYLDILEAAWFEHLVKRDDNAPTVISLFAGAGGSSLGYSMAGYRELLAVEWNDNAVETLKLNFPDMPVYHGDITKLSVDECLHLADMKPGELDVLDGSPPCQGFSTAGKRQLDDPRNSLAMEFVRLLRGLQPKIFVMENVSGMVKGKMKLVFAEIMQELKASGYQVRCQLMNTKYFNVPQSRQRLIWIGIRNDLGMESSYPEMKKPFTSNQAIEHLVNNGGPDLTPVSEEYWPMLKYGESASKYHPKGHLFGMVKLDPNKPSPTLLKSCGNPVCHWSMPRFLSKNELKLLSSFHVDFKVIGSIGNIRDRIGNSVPPLFMKAIAEHIKTEILERWSVMTGGEPVVE